jgi:hypothetical protein
VPGLVKRNGLKAAAFLFTIGEGLPLLETALIDVDVVAQVLFCRFAALKQSSRVLSRFNLGSVVPH